MHIVFDARRIHAVTSRGRYTTRQPGVMAECRVEAKSKFSQDGNGSLLGAPECGRGGLGLGIADDSYHILPYSVQDSPSLRTSQNNLFPKMADQSNIADDLIGPGSPVGRTTAKPLGGS
jgi:hypothetical protein